MMSQQLQLVGRSSSHFTRVARIFAYELGVPVVFRPIFDMMSLETSNYADNPALKMPVLVDENGPLFGTENICRVLVERAACITSNPSSGCVVLAGATTNRLIANAEELVLHVMSNEVSLITSKITGTPAPPKIVRSIENTLTYLDTNVDALMAALPADRLISFVEVALFCVVTHLPWREVMEVSSWKHLTDFCARFGERESAKLTAYCFDKP